MFGLWLFFVRFFVTLLFVAFPCWVVDSMFCLLQCVSFCVCVFSSVLTVVFVVVFVVIFVFVVFTVVVIGLCLCLFLLASLFFLCCL